MLFSLAFAFLFTSLANAGHADESEARNATPSPITADNQQLLIVSTPFWRASTGTMGRYERADNAWRLVGAPFAVALGRNGMAWGRGLHAELPKLRTSELTKKEGDGRSPAGVFSLGSAFGVSPELPASNHAFPYLSTLPSTYCVEDTRSLYYNQIVDRNEVGPSRWEQWSQMRRPDGLFDWGVVVQQNWPEPTIGAGSCVFLHIWRGAGRPTAGCTAMAKEQLEETLRWLDARAQPLLVQLPEAEYGQLKEQWGLP